MTTTERIKALCKEKGIAISKLEVELGFSNGSLSKSESVKADRLLEIAKYFNVTMEYLITGEDSYEKEPLDLRIAARHLNEIPCSDRERILKNFESSIDLYLKAKKG